MPLTVRQDGQTVGGQPNNATAAWWNDYHDLLTGAMLDQPISLAGSLTTKGTLANPTVAPSGAIAAGTALGIGAYQYVYTYVTPGGETAASPALPLTTTSGNQAVSLSSVPTGATPTSARKIYRTKVGGSTFYLLTTLNDNTTTTYNDTTTDASLGTATPPTHNQAGALFIHDSTGAARGQINPDGSVSFDGGTLTSDGAGHLTLASVAASGAVNAATLTSSGLTTAGSLTVSGGATLGSLNMPGASAGMEVGDTTSANTPHIDFHSIAYANDYDTRIIASGGTNAVNGAGNLDIYATLVHFHGYISATSFNGPLNNGITSNDNSTYAVTVIDPQEPAGTGRSILLQSWDGTTVHNAFSVGSAGTLRGNAWVDDSGNISGPVGGGIPTTRNGAATSVPIYTGTTTPSSPPTGAIWIKA